MTLFSLPLWSWNVQARMCVWGFWLWKNVKKYIQRKQASSVCSMVLVINKDIHFNVSAIRLLSEFVHAPNAIGATSPGTAVHTLHKTFNISATESAKLNYKYMIKTTAVKERSAHILCITQHIAHPNEADRKNEKQEGKNERRETERVRTCLWVHAAAYSIAYTIRCQRTSRMHQPNISIFQFCFSSSSSSLDFITGLSIGRTGKAIRRTSNASWTSMWAYGHLLQPHYEQHSTQLIPIPTP